MVNQLLAAAAMGVYVVVVLFATKYPYTMMVTVSYTHLTLPTTPYV